MTKFISRFARNVQDCLETIRKLKLLGIAVRFEKEAIDTLTTESELMFSILSSVAEEELASISQNMHWSNQRRASCHSETNYTIGRKNSCGVGRIKEDTIKGLFIRVFNRLYTDRAKLLGDYKAKLEREKLTELDNERIAKLDEEIEKLIKQERALFLYRRKRLRRPQSC
ncbi:recombinase family protein [Desulfosporosinus acididurans]|uniref:recombinase family protein n=1 Tax=Desulfosporosinus acididurans TaxID=476652 RepID=UPI0031F33A25